MTPGKTLFEVFTASDEALSVHAARASDPATSHQAARESAASETRRSQLRLVMEAVKVAPGLTSAELGAFLNMDRYAVARRLPELRRVGLVTNGPAKHCSRTGKVGITWNPTTKGLLP